MFTGLALFLRFMKLRDTLFAAGKWVGESTTHILITISVILGATAYWQHHEAAKMAIIAQHTKAAWNAAQKDALAAQAVAEQRYKEQADEADRNHQAAITDGDARLATYIANHRVRPSAQTDSARPSQDRNPDFSKVAPTETVVASVVDLQVCTDNYAYAKAAYDWVQGLNAK